ncbi:hypothetical protein ACFQ34_03910 [Pseudonocardia benzenivorans]|uniref:CopG family transcriptional regulator n=1 Tax=Pseudonocardia benzenivorans TaxID=228005 RepID=A0ABW3VE64_9PSEU|nr:hypothetical protein [Pseudonocardia dioxanivorans]GJF04362.1 hypothetical protein PSD17_33180 [Pseudonocardia sp. D17]
MAADGVPDDGSRPARPRHRVPPGTTRANDRTADRTALRAGRSRASGGRPPRSGDALPAHDPELDSYLAALAPDTDGPLESTGRFGTAQVFQLRLPPLRVEQLRRVAEERGVSPGSLALDWVIERLDREDMPTGPLERVRDEPARRPRFRRRKP